jgi:FkbM family methyltransferase
MFRGEDTAFYVTRGYRVVGVEANAELVPLLQQRFSTEIATGQVVLLPVAVGTKRGTARFAISSGAPSCSTADDAYLQTGRRTKIDFEVVSVEMVTLPDLVARYGVPYYMKVDLEGMDHAVVASLISVEGRPPRLSIESATTGSPGGPAAVIREIRMLRRLGYRRFKLVEQTRLSAREGTPLSLEGRPVVYSYEEGASGPFGDEAEGPWRTRASVLPRMLLHDVRHQLMSHRGWLASTRVGSRLRSQVVPTVRAVAPIPPTGHPRYDLHARL